MAPSASSLLQAKKQLTLTRNYYNRNASVVEQEVGAMPFEGVFDDWNERAVQFGYLVLPPCLPAQLTPALL